MNDRHTDDDLRALFEAQRMRDAGNAPRFATMLERAHAALRDTDVHATGPTSARSAHAVHDTRNPRGMRRRTEWLGGLAAAAAIAALVLMPRLAGSGDAAFEEAVRAFRSDPALGAWQSPTESLLKLPGDGLLTTVPEIGTAR